MKPYLRLCLVIILASLMTLIVIILPSRSASTNGPWYVTAAGGDDANDCLGAVSACATIQGVLDKLDFTAGDTILVASGVYTHTAAEVVLLDKDAILSGGWDADFILQEGSSIIDGESIRRGIVVSFGVSATLEQFIIQNGSASDGGGIQNSGALTISHSTLQGNTAQNGGGLANYATGTVSFLNSTIRNNTATTVTGECSLDDCTGGGIFNQQGTIHLVNSTISGNTVTGTVSCDEPSCSGGGIFVISGTVTLLNSTLADNHAGQDGGGILLSSGFITLTNSILAGNTAVDAGPDCQGPIVSLGYNLFGDTTGCSISLGTGDLPNEDPALDPLMGSPAYHPLTSDSPAIDAGNPTGCTDHLGNPLLTDQRGVVRVGVCDMGSYEYIPPGPTSITALSGTPQHMPPLSSLALPLQAQVLDSFGSPVNNITVTFSAPTSGASGIFSDSGTISATALTDDSGIATLTGFTANAELGAYTVIGAVEGLTGAADFLLTNILWFVSTNGDDLNTCLTTAAPCQTINGALAKGSFFDGDTLLAATGAYTGAGEQVVLLDQSAILSGGWDEAFSLQDGVSTLDGQLARRGITVNNDVTASIQRFVIQHGMSDAQGGGIYNLGSLQVDHSAVLENTANTGAGIYSSGTLVVYNSAVNHNSALGSLGGGGIYLSGAGSLLHLNNSTISHNTASRGGGVRLSSGQLTANSATISHNTASELDGAGGIQNDAGSVSLQNSLLADNSGSIAPDCLGSITSAGYDLIGDDTGCTFAGNTGDLVNTDPHLFAFTGLPGYHPLLQDSPAIDAGNPAGCTDHLGNPLLTDQAGMPRIMDGDRDGNAICDIGAYEKDPDNPVGQIFLPITTRNYCPPLFADDFTYPVNGWLMGDDGKVRYEYLDGEYRILIRITQWSAFSRPNFSASDYILTADVRNFSGFSSLYGFMFEISDDWSQFYSFLIDQNGNYYIFRYGSGTWTLLTFGNSASIHTGTILNHLKLKRDGALIEAYANDELLATVSDASYTGLRQVGLFVSAYNQAGVDVRFDNFSVYPATCNLGDIQ